MLREEAGIVAHRINTLLATQATLTQMAIGSVLSKKVGAALKKTISDMTQDGKT